MQNKATNILAQAPLKGIVETLKLLLIRKEGNAIQISKLLSKLVVLYQEI